MDTTRSTDTEYLTPAEMAEMADELITESHATIADHLGVSRSAVSHALGDQPRRHVRLLCRILRLHGIDAEPEPSYPVRR